MTSRTWRIQDGLPDQVVQAIAQTPDHYLWLGSKLGLVRFDGFHFVDYGVEAAPVLREFGVSCILPARDGSLWLGTQGGGVVHLLRGIVKVRNYGAAEGIENGLIRSLYQDESGRIWAGADHGLYRLASAGANEKFHRVDDPAATPNLGIHAIISDGHGGVWAGGSRLLHYGPFAEGEHSSEVKLPRQPTSVRIWSLAVAPDKSLYVGTLGGLFRVTANGEVQRQNHIPGSVLSLHLDGKRRLWVGTLADGVFLVERDGSVSRAIFPSQLARNAVLAISEDFGHDLWVGTQSGLERFSATGMQIKRIPGAVDAEFGSVAVDDDSSVWVCSRQLVHMQHGQFRTVDLPALHGAAVRSVIRERSGAFWAGTLGRGAYRITPDGHVDHYTSAIGTNYIRGFLETPEDGVWIASDGGVANWHNGHLKSYQEIPGSPLAPAIAMSAGAPGELWVGTYRGLYLLKQGRYVSSEAASALGGHVVWALHRSRDGALWIGTESGLFRWSNGGLRRIPLDRDLGDSSVLSILEDGRGRMWLAGLTTVLRADRSALEALAGDPTGDLPFSPEIFAVSRETGTELTGGATSTAQLDGADGAWFATHEGPLHIQPSMAEADLTPPPIMLHSVVMDGRRSPAGQSFTLEPSAKTLEIEAAPVVLSSRPGLHLRRRLIGFDTDWLDLSPRNLATYTNLPPGHYTFRVEASWEGKNGTTYLEIPIIQRAHFYREPLFLFGCAALVLLSVWIIYLFRVRQMTIRFRLISEERSRVAREIHDTVVQSCIGVSSLLEAIAIRQPREASGSETTLLDTAREQIALTIVEARDAIWDLRHPQDQGGLAHSLRSMLDRMTAVQNTLVEFQCEGTPRALERETEHELLMTAREALHNSIAHASSTHVLLRLRYEVDKVTIHLHDDGRGFDTHSHHNNESMHFGLVGMRERMERISGSCTIVSVPGQGADVTLELPTSRHPKGGAKCLTP